MLRRRLLPSYSWPLPWTTRRRSSNGNVVLSERRLKEFVTAEINYFAGMCPKPVALTEIFKASTAHQAAALIHKQLPMHFATRIRQIEQVPHWDAVPEMQDVHRTLSRSFHNLRLLEQRDDLEPLTEVVNDLRERHKSILPLLSNAMAHLRAEGLVTEDFVDQWLDSFLLARIGTDMLTLHYVMLSSKGEVGSRAGVVDSRCDPGEVCREAAASISRDPRFFGVAMHVEAHVCNTSGKGIAFQFVPQYLKLIVSELLKNSAAATVRNAPASKMAEKPGDLGVVTVYVGADDYQVMIEISDKGGGIPAKHADKIWSYNWSGIRGERKHEELASWTDPLEGLGIKQRLGMGLPLTRLYTHYFGGEFNLMSIPSLGTDAFIHLKRIDKASAPGAPESFQIDGI